MQFEAPPEVLIVEDDPNFATQLYSAVKRWYRDARITHRATGTDAVSWIETSQQRIDLALVDLGLPDMDGCGVIAVARRHYAKTPILVVSLLASERAVVGAIQSGANGYITKDDNDRTIAAAISEVMAGNYPLSPALARHLFHLISSSGIHSEVDLTQRETETLRCIGRGLSYQQTAMEMGISLSTVQSHVRNLYRKLDVNSQSQAALKARDRGLI